MNNKFEESYVKNQDAWNFDKYPLMGRQRIDETLKYKRNFTRTLDIGCGVGYSTFTLSNTNNVIGIDVSPTTCKRAKINYPKLQFCIADIKHLPFKNKVFGQISCIDVLEYFKSNLKVPLNEMSRVSKNNAVYIFAVSVGKNGYYDKTKFIKVISADFTILKAFPVSCRATMVLCKYFPKLIQKYLNKIALIIFSNWHVAFYCNIKQL